MDGTEQEGGLLLKLSSKSKTGYECVIKVREGEYHAKLKVRGERGQRTLPGKACATPREAAIRLAQWRAAGCPQLEKTNWWCNSGARAARGEGERPKKKQKVPEAPQPPVEAVQKPVAPEPLFWPNGYKQERFVASSETLALVQKIKAAARGSPECA